MHVIGQMIATVTLISGFDHFRFRSVLAITWVTLKIVFHNNKIESYTGLYSLHS